MLLSCDGHSSNVNPEEYLELDSVDSWIGDYETNASIGYITLSVKNARLYTSFADFDMRQLVINEDSFYLKEAQDSSEQSVHLFSLDRKSGNILYKKYMDDEIIIFKRMNTLPYPFISISANCEVSKNLLINIASPSNAYDVIYATDGSDPNDSLTVSRVTKGSEFFQLDRSLTVRVRTIDDRGNLSECQTYNYSITDKKITPALTVDLDVANIQDFNDKYIWVGRSVNTTSDFFINKKDGSLTLCQYPVLL